MGEIFVMERPEEAPRFTGERLTGAASGQIEIEHLHRYFLVREMARGKDVLDIGCGEGYGAALIAQVAISVVAIDVSPEAIDHAKNVHCRANIEFRSGDARRIDAPDDAFDLVASFETLEHFYEHAQFYREIRRVLRPGGVLVISTPDRDVYSPDGSTANRYHVHELTRGEFETGLCATFPYVALLLQRSMIGSLMFAAEPKTAELSGLTFERRGTGRFERNAGLPRAPYLIAFASDQPVCVPVASAYVETSQLAVRENEFQRQLELKDAEASRRITEAEVVMDGRMVEARGLAERRLAEVQLINMQATEQRLTEAREQAEWQLSRSEAEYHRAEHLLIQTQQALLNMQKSNSWRVSAPLRAIMRIVRPRAHHSSDSVPNPRADLPPKVVREYQPVTANPMLEPIPRQIASFNNRMRQRQALGIDLAQPVLSIVVGIVTFNTDDETLLRCLSSADIAFAQAGGAGSILIIDNGAPSAIGENGRSGVFRHPVRKLGTSGNIGFGRAHNVLMREAFEGGADVYIATNPDGAFHHQAIDCLARVVAAHGGRALVEACQFPAEHPKEYDPITLETLWASGACLAIPRAVFEATSGFDDDFFMYCEDVDLSWRVCAAEMKVLIAPNALFLHAVTNRTSNDQIRKMMLESAVLLGRKWSNSAFVKAVSAELIQLGGVVPGTEPDPVPAAWREIPDFGRAFSFAPVRW